MKKKTIRQQNMQLYLFRMFRHLASAYCITYVVCIMWQMKLPSSNIGNIIELKFPEGQVFLIAVPMYCMLIYLSLSRK